MNANTQDLRKISPEPHIVYVLPAKNEAKSLSLLIPEIWEHSRDILTSHVSIIVIDDGGSDDTSKVLECLEHEYSGAFSIKLIELAKNYGKEAAVVAGLRNIPEDATRVVIMDADGQHSPSNAVEMLRLSLNEDCCVVGVHDHSSRNWGYRTLARSLARLTSGGTGQIGINDFRVLIPSAWSAFCEMPERSRYSRELFNFLGFKTLFFQISIRPRLDGSESRWSFHRLTSYALISIVSASTSFLPLMILVSVLLGTIVGGYAVVVSVLSLSAGNRSGTASVLLTLVSFQFILLVFQVFVSALLVNILTEVKRRPLYFEKTRGAER